MDSREATAQYRKEAAHPPFPLATRREVEGTNVFEVQINKYPKKHAFNVNLHILNIIQPS
jgi:hypothetical protein